MKYAAIDIGSNAVRLFIADIIEANDVISFKKNTLIRVPLRLGDDAFLDKHISDRKASELVKTMHAFKHLMDVYKVQKFMACATSAMREANNGKELAERILAETGINLHIIHGQIEAKIIYSSHADQILDKKRTYLYIDVGGGSTELSVFANGKMIASNSFDIGTIRILDNQDKDETWIAMRDWLKDNVKNFKSVVGIGSGGNINKLFKLSGEKEKTALTINKLKTLYDYLNSFSLKDRINVLGLNQDRADVIIPACEIFLTVMKWSGIKTIHVPKVGLVDGIINVLIEENFIENK